MQHRLLLTGPFNADHHARALDALSERLDRGARDVLYIVASGAARRRVIADLLARRQAVFGLSVKTLSSLPSELFRRAHLREPSPIDSAVAAVLAERELRTATGNRFDGTTPVQGLAASAAFTIDLLERTGATPEQLASALDGQAVTDGARALTQTWRGIALKRTRLGSAEPEILAAARDLLREHDGLLRGIDAIVIEDLALRTPLERELVAALIAAAPCDVIAAHGYVRQLPDAPSSRALVSLRVMAEWSEVACESRVGSLDSLFATRDSGAPAGGVPTTLLEAPGDVGEVRLAARVVRRHLDAGVPADEIAIVVHAGASRYRELIREVFEPAGIPTDATPRRTAADTSLGALLLELLDLAIDPESMTREASLAVARSVHVGLRPHDRDRLERRIVTKGYLGLDGWSRKATKTLGEHAANRINRLKRAIAAARAGFERVKSAADAAKVTRTLVGDLRLVHNAVASRVVIPSGAPKARSRGIAGIPKEGLVIPSGAPKARSRGIAGIPKEGTLYREDCDSSTPALRAFARNDNAIREDNIAWEAIDKALDRTIPQMLDIDRSGAGKTGLAFATAWLAMVDRALGETPVAAERASAGAVQVRSTGPGCDAPTRVTIVLGLIEKVFPRQARQDPFLDDELRTHLRARFGWDLPVSTDRVDRERECFIRAIASATDALYLSYPATDADGRPSVRSFFIDDYEAMVGAALRVERANTPSAIAHLGDTVTQAELMTSIAHDIWQYLPRTADSATNRAAAFRALEALARQEAADVSPVRHGRRVSQRPRLEGVLPAEAPHLTLSLSASQLKSIGHCTYQHFVDKVLTPITLAPPEYDNLSKGDFIHDALMYWASTLDGWNRGEAALPELQQWFADTIAKWSPALRGTERTARATEADTERLVELLREELALLQAPNVAQPAFAELAFGEKMIDRGPRHPASRTDAFMMEIATDVGVRSVSFHGSLDRVDVVSVGGKQYGVVIDYKSGKDSKHYAKEMMSGDDLQLRLYLLVLEKFWNITPIGALYLGLGDGVRRGAVRADFVSRIAGIQDGAVEPLSSDEWDRFINATPGLIAKLVNRLVTLDVRPDPRKKKCGFCDKQPICRYDRWDMSFRAERPRSARGVEES